MIENHFISQHAGHSSTWCLEVHSSSGNKKGPPVSYISTEQVVNFST